MTNSTSYTTSDKNQDGEYKDFCDAIECYRKATEKYKVTIDESTIIILNLCKKCNSVFKGY